LIESTKKRVEKSGATDEFSGPDFRNQHSVSVYWPEHLAPILNSNRLTDTWQRAEKNRQDTGPDTFRIRVPPGRTVYVRIDRSAMASCALAGSVAFSPSGLPLGARPNFIVGYPALSVLIRPQLRFPMKLNRAYFRPMIESGFFDSESIAGSALAGE